MKIPYGIANFARIRKDGYFYVDKTPFLPLLESAERGYSSLMLLRPRRMGKSARPKDIEATFAQAAAQLGRYMSDSGLPAIVAQGKEMRAGTLVFVSGRDVLFRPWEPGDKPGSARGKAPRPKVGARRPAKSTGTGRGRRP